MRDFFDKFALLGTLAAIGFVDVVLSRAQEKKRHMVCLPCFKVWREEIQNDFSTYASSRRSGDTTTIDDHRYV